MAFSEVLFEALFEYIIVFPNSTFLESSVWLGRGATFNCEKQVSEAEGPNPDLNYSSVTYGLQDLHLHGPLSLFTCRLRVLSHISEPLSLCPSSVSVLCLTLCWSLRIPSQNSPIGRHFRRTEGKLRKYSVGSFPPSGGLPFKQA